MKQLIEHHIKESLAIKAALLEVDYIEQIEIIAATLITCLKAGNKVLFAGNGGSAADAQHIAAEFVGRFETERNPLPGIALTTDTSALTAIANDYGYDQVFARQLKGLGQTGDIFFGISTSGNSKNIIAAIDAAKQHGLNTIALTGSSGKLKQLADFCLAVPSSRTAIIQESHIMLGHILCGLIDQAFPVGQTTC